METVEMDLMQAQIAELTTEVTRLQSDVSKNSNVVINSYPDIMAAAMQAIQTAITEILTDQTTFAYKTVSLVDEASEQMFLDFKKAATAVVKGNSATIIIPGEGDLYNAYKITQANTYEHQSLLEFAIPVYTIESPVTAAFNIYFRFVAVYTNSVYGGSATAFVHKLS